MDRNTTIGLILIGLLLTVFTVMNRPTDEDIQQAKEQQRKSQSATNTQPAATSNASNSSTVNTPKVDTGKKKIARRISLQPLPKWFALKTKICASILIPKAL